MYQSPYGTAASFQPMQTPIIPALNFPTNFNPQPQLGPQLTRVNGLDSAKAFPTVANAMYALFDENDDILYIKQTDASNYPTVKRYRFVLEEEKPVAPVQYVTIEEFNKFKEELLNAKQPIWPDAEHVRSSKSTTATWADLTAQKHDGNDQGI